MQSLQDEVEALRVQARTAAKHEAELLLLRDKTAEQTATIADLASAKSELAKLTEQHMQLVHRPADAADG